MEPEPFSGTSSHLDATIGHMALKYKECADDPRLFGGPSVASSIPFDVAVSRVNSVPDICLPEQAIPFLGINSVVPYVAWYDWFTSRRLVYSGIYRAS
ncbi:MAG: hypothetical protein K0S45_2060 [Nitrospira sp.]|nr:hypothetical protein [Nitrospira sp.]